MVHKRNTQIGEQLVHLIPWGTILTLNEIRQQPVAQIPWGSIIQIMTSSKSHEEILWNINETHKLGW